MFILGRHFWDQ